MAIQRRKQVFDCGGGQKVTTFRRPGGPRVRVGYPPDSVLASVAPTAGRRYIRDLFHRAVERLADIIDDETPDTGRVATTLAHIAPDNTIITAHTSAAHVTLYVRNKRTHKVRAYPLLDPRHYSGMRVQEHDPARFRITRNEELFICIESGDSHDALPAAERTAALAKFLNGRRGKVEKTAEYLTRLAVRAGAPGHITITFARLKRDRADNLVLALFEGEGAEGHRLAAGMVPVIRGILERDRQMQQPRPPSFTP
jgi:hypothetical protein